MTFEKISARGFGKNNSDGFVLLLFVLSLPLILSLFLYISVLAQTIQEQNWVQKVCYKKITSSLSQQRRHILRLLKLNPRAIRLRQERIELKAKLMAAIIARQEILVMTYERKLEENFLKQLKLDAKQKSIVMEIQNLIIHDAIDLRKKVEKTQDLLQERTKNLTESQESIVQLRSPGVAIHPDDPLLAPTYSLDPALELRTNWSLSWKRQNSNRSFQRSLIDFQTTKEGVCSASLRQIKPLEFLVVRKDKF